MKYSAIAFFVYDTCLENSISNSIPKMNFKKANKNAEYFQIFIKLFF